MSNKVKTKNRKRNKKEEVIALNYDFRNLTIAMVAIGIRAAILYYFFSTGYKASGLGLNDYLASDVKSNVFYFLALLDLSCFIEVYYTRAFLRSKRTMYLGMALLIFIEVVQILTFNPIAIAFIAWFIYKYYREIYKDGLNPMTAITEKRDKMILIAHVLMYVLIISFVYFFLIQSGLRLF